MSFCLPRRDRDHTHDHRERSSSGMVPTILLPVRFSDTVITFSTMIQLGENFLGLKVRSIIAGSHTDIRKSKQLNGNGPKTEIVHGQVQNLQA